MSITLRNHSLRSAGLNHTESAMNHTGPAPSSIFANHMTKVREAAHLRQVPSLADIVIRLANQHYPHLLIVPACRPVSATSGAPAYDDGVVAVHAPTEGCLDPQTLGKTVSAAHALHDALIGAGEASYDPPVLGSDIAEAEGRRRDVLHSQQMMERAMLVRLLNTPADQPRRPADLEWAASILDAWAEEPHPLDRAGDPTGYGGAQVDRASRVGHAVEMARDAAHHWRAGTPGTDAHDAPAVAWITMRALLMELGADDLEYRALMAMFPGA